MSYLQVLRSHIGPMKIPLVYASACVEDAQGRLLWQRRADFGCWGLPGGVLELKESLPACVVREVYEETGLDVSPVRLVGVYSSPEFDVTYPNGDQVQQVTFCFACRVVGGSLHPDNDETLDLAWFAPDARVETLPWYRAMVADLRARRPAASFAHGAEGMTSERVPYYPRVREYIGHAPLIFPAAAAVVQDEMGRVLLQLRRDDGCWSLPGGMLELGERIDQTIAQEVCEETGIEVAPVRLIGAYSGPELYHVYPNGDRAQSVAAVFACRKVGGALHADGVESRDVRFFSPEALPDLPAYYLHWIQDGLAGQAAAAF